MILTRRQALLGASGALIASRARGLIFPGGSAASSSYIPWTPAYYQNFDSYSPGTSGILNTYGISGVSNLYSYSTPNSGGCNVTAGANLTTGGAAQALTSGTPAAGNQVWFRVRMLFPTGFDFSAGGGGSGTALKFLRIETDPSGSRSPAHIDCYLSGGNATAVGGFDFIYESGSGWILGGSNDSSTICPSGITRGVFHTFEVYYALSSTNTGVVWRMWRDGSLIFDTTRNIPQAPAQTNLMNLASGYVIPTITSDPSAAGFMNITFWNGTANQNQTWYVDDFTIATDVAGQLPPYFDSFGNRYIGMQNP